MPTLDFKGKSFVYTHHLSVPFRELVVDPKRSLPPAKQKPSLDDNLIIHGDNLHALKALLPMYAGKVDCIFIDPPYNTGNEGWCYNDNVRGPLIQQWIQDEANPVDKEDLERHDKWLCMMWPRLQLLHELLAEDGAIWVTLDDNEVFRAKGVMDEIFGLENFRGSVIWQHSVQPKGYSGKFSVHHNYMLLYAKSELFQLDDLERTEEHNVNYSNPDNDPRGRWRVGDVRNALNRDRLKYEIVSPCGNRISPPDKGWRYSENTMKSKIESGEIVFNGDETGIIRKIYLETVEGRTPETIWFGNSVGTTRDAANEQKQILGSAVLETAKPTKLVELAIGLASRDDAIILDSFAGSGTTGHAVLAANKNDGGNRKFILVEMEDYADKLTAERVRRVIDGYSFKGTQREELHRENVTWTRLKKASELVEQVEKLKMLEGDNFDKITPKVDGGQFTITGEKKITEKVDGLGGSFTFATLGQEMTLDKLLGGETDGGDMPTYESLAKYVFYTATGRTLDKLPPKTKRKHGFIGEIETYRVHLIYEPDAKWLASNDAALTETLVDTLVDKNPDKSKRLLVFAPAKFMSQKELTRRGVDFCQLPYAIHRILGD